MTTTAAERAALGRRWERVTEWPLMIAAVVFLAAYAVPILDPGLPSWLLDSCLLLSWLTWGIFVVDFAVRLFLAEERLRYIVRHWYDPW
jgi:voltage-gated potassium channel